MTMKPKSEAIKGVRIASVEETVDEAMKFLPLSMDLADPVNRAKVRDWMVRIGGVIVQRNVQSFTDAAKSAIDEAGALAIDPHYHQRLAKRREKRRAIAAARIKVERMTREQRAFESLKVDPKSLQ